MTKLSLLDRLEQFFREHQGQWVDGQALAHIAGAYAWRTRVSELRRQRGLTVDNRLRHVREHADTCPAIQASDIPGACRCDTPIKWTVSEYRFVPAVEPQQASLLEPPHV